MDLLNFEAEDLYFEHEDVRGVSDLLQQASSLYGTGQAELPLLQAYFKAPASLNVLVALNRFYYYQHRLDEALEVTCRALDVIRKALPFPEHWQALQRSHLDATPPALLTQVRLYLFTLKALGFLTMRLQHLAQSQAIFEKIVELDSKDRIGALGLLTLVKKHIANKAL